MLNSRPLLHLATLLSIILSVRGLGKLPIAFCTPENSKCLLASDGKLDTCFAAKRIDENFYFAVFNTVGQPVAVDKIRLNVGKGHTNNTKYIVSLAGGAAATDLKCNMSHDAQTIECPAGLPNITSMMIRSEPLPIRLNLAEVAAFNRNGAPVRFSGCEAIDGAVNCSLAMDHDMATAAVSEPTQFPSWYGNLEVPDSISLVKIHRPKPKSRETATSFRVFTPNSHDCKQVVGQTKEDVSAVEVLEFQCSGMLDSLLRVWEFSSDFLITLCEIEVIGG